MSAILCTATLNANLTDTFIFRIMWSRVQRSTDWFYSGTAFVLICSFRNVVYVYSVVCSVPFLTSDVSQVAPSSRNVTVQEKTRLLPKCETRTSRRTNAQIRENLSATLGKVLMPRTSLVATHSHIVWSWVEEFATRCKGYVRFY